MSAVVSVENVNVEAIRESSAPWPLKAHQLEITDTSMVQLAGEYLQDIKTLRKLIAEKVDPVIKANHAAHRASLALKRDLESELVDADRMIAGKIATWQNAQARQQRLLEAAAAAKAKATREEAEAEARALKAAGEDELAELTAAEAKMVVASRPLAPPSVRVPGVSTRRVYKAHVTDMAALVKAVADGRVPLAALQANETVLNQQARSLGEALDWPGVEVLSDTVVVRK